MENLSKCEEEIFLTVYLLGENAALGEVVDVVNRNYQHDWKSQTVSTYFYRLIQKGYITIDKRIGHKVYYKPTISLRRYQMMKLKEIEDGLFGGNIELFEKRLQELKRREKQVRCRKQCLRLKKLNL